MLPEAALQVVRRWAAERTPSEFQDRMRVELAVHPRGLTTVECSLMPNLDGEVDWLRVPSARLSYSSGSGEWTLYSFDRNGKVHRYPDFEPSREIQDLLDEIEDDPTCIFWG
ncbi:MAG: hypothetical protein QOG69_2825 [Actinomycetota bacterium]|nr:hypothetical protein [Actinomycetota bacterium]